MPSITSIAGTANQIFANGATTPVTSGSVVLSIPSAYNAFSLTNNLQTNGGGTGSNISIGYNALSSFTGSSNNIAIGNISLQNLTDGIHNIALGYQSGGALINSDFNVLIGTYSGKSIDSGIGQNVAIGYNALTSDTSSTGMTCIGHNCIPNSNGQTYSVVVGYNAGLSASSGTDNVLLGASTGGTNLGSGSNNILIGAGADVLSSNASNQIIIGNSSSNTFYFPGIGIDFNVSVTGGLTINNDFSTPYNYTLPITDGTPGQIMTWPGSGSTLVWSSNAGQYNFDNTTLAATSWNFDVGGATGITGDIILTELYNYFTITLDVTNFTNLTPTSNTVIFQSSSSTPIPSAIVGTLIGGVSILLGKMWIYNGTTANIGATVYITNTGTTGSPVNVVQIICDSPNQLLSSGSYSFNQQATATSPISYQFATFTWQPNTVFP
jgi:hypothetical protein